MQKKIIDEKVIGPGVVGRRAFNHTRKFFLHVWRCVRAWVCASFIILNCSDGRNFLSDSFAHCIWFACFQQFRLNMFIATFFQQAKLNFTTISSMF